MLRWACASVLSMHALWTRPPAHASPAAEPIKKRQTTLIAVFIDSSLAASANAIYELDLRRSSIVRAVDRLSRRAQLLARKNASAGGHDGAPSPPVQDDLSGHAAPYEQDLDGTHIGAFMFASAPSEVHLTHAGILNWVVRRFAEHVPAETNGIFFRSLLDGVPSIQLSTKHGDAGFDEPTAELSPALPAVSSAARETARVSMPLRECGSRWLEIEESIKRTMSSYVGGPCDQRDYDQIFAGISSLCENWLRQYSNVIVIIACDSNIDLKSLAPLEEIQRRHPPELPDSRLCVCIAPLAPSAEIAPGFRQIASPFAALPGKLPALIQQTKWDDSVKECEGRCYFPLVKSGPGMDRLVKVLQSSAMLKMHSFLSHAWGTKYEEGKFAVHEKVIKINSDLEDGFALLSWIDNDELRGREGCSLPDLLVDGIENSSVFVALITYDYVTRALSDHDSGVRKEVIEAERLLHAGKIRVLPVLLAEPIDPSTLPPEIAALPIEERRKWLREEVSCLASSLLKDHFGELMYMDCRDQPHEEVVRMIGERVTAMLKEPNEPAKTPVAPLP
eukprot:m.12463 g.12463  ORF g.12463 m.12463 type:complete len:562 (-) comp2732_c0_seq1:70-1755(-)